MLITVIARYGIVGLDLVEVNPYLDPSQLTALIGARLVIETIGEILGGKTGELKRTKQCRG
ncbi:MAG: arginase family protein [Bacillota bacterium]